MFKVDRHEANDRLWVLKVRKCISTRSEALWEKLKDTLGVSPELDEEKETEEEERLDIKDLGKRHKLEGELAVVDVDGSDRLEELAEPICALGVTGLLMESKLVEPASHLATPWQRGGTNSRCHGSDW